mgnify:CR=1 FL=1
MSISKQFTIRIPVPVFHCLAVFATHGDPVLAVQGAGKQGERPLSARHIVHTPGSQRLRYRHIVRKPVSHSICKKNLASFREEFLIPQNEN